MQHDYDYATPMAYGVTMTGDSYKVTSDTSH